MIVGNIDEKGISSLVMFFLSLGLIIGVMLLIVMSIYYRVYLYRKKSVPFEVPAFLSCLFPKPINYEHEITVLCSKYMNN